DHLVRHARPAEERPARTGAALHRHHAGAGTGAVASAPKPVFPARDRPRHQPPGAACGFRARHRCIPEHQRGRVSSDHSCAIAGVRRFARFGVITAEGSAALNPTASAKRIMTAHQRSVSASIDPVKLDRLAEVAVRVGLQLQPGQDLLLTAPSVALPLVRKIAEHAYKAGAGIVTPFLSDEEITLARYRYGHNESFDRAAGWLYEGMAKAFSANTARLAIVGDNPMLLSGEDPAKVARASKANSIAYQPALEKIVNFDTNWNIIAYPSPSWAKQVFPDVPEDVAIGKLADAIFAASRV